MLYAFTLFQEPGSWFLEIDLAIPNTEAFHARGVTCQVRSQRLPIGIPQDASGTWLRLGCWLLPVWIGKQHPFSFLEKMRLNA